MTDSLDKPKEFELKLTEMEAGSGAIPITWCLSPEWLEKNKIQEYWVLISTYQPDPSGIMAEWRGYAKLSDMMTYVTFLRPGVNHITARLSNSKDTVKGWMARDSGGWETQEIDFPQYDWELEEFKKGKWKFHAHRTPHDRPQDHLQVDIPEECFAKEPSEFEKLWVNWMWKYKSIDQCEFRRRRMFAYSIQPIIFLGLMLIRLIVMLSCLMVALRGLNWGPIFSPLNYRTEDITKDVGYSYFHIKRLPDPASYVFIPSIPLGLAVGLVNFFFGESLSSIVIHALIGTVFIPSIGLFVAVLVSFAFWLSDKVKIIQRVIAALERWSEKREIAREREWAAQQIKYKETMMCSNTKVIRKLSDLPKDKRTVRLRFQGVKSMVCRPFAK